MRVCAVIPAAGSGSRLKLDRPKLLAPIGQGVSPWNLLREKLADLVDHIHVILSPEGQAAFSAVLDAEESGVPISVGIQPHPIGMGDAVFRGLPVWRHAEVVLVIWGDQVHVSRETVRGGLSLHECAARRLVLPLVKVAKPYVEYRFDGAGRLTDILQQREGDCCRPDGWGDVGTFILSTAGLDEEWRRFVEAKEVVGPRTGEINFLPFLPFLARRGWDVKRLPVADPLEARGINTPEDLAFFRELYRGEAARGSLTMLPKEKPETA